MSERLPPHNLDAERAVLGSLLIDRDAIIKVAPILEPADFYDRRHATLYRAIVTLYHRRTPADLITLTDELERRGELEQVGGVSGIQQLMQEVPTAVHALYYAEVVRDAAIERRIGKLAQKVAELAYDTTLDVPSKLAKVHEVVTKATTIRRTDGYRTGPDLASRAYDRLEERLEERIPYGIEDLDRKIGGMKRGQLIVPAGRPSTGKTSFGVKVAHQNLRKGRSVGIISLEMDADEITDRLLALESGVNMFAFRQAKAVLDQTWKRISNAIGKLHEWKIFVDDRCTGHLSDVLARARLMHAAQGLDLLIVDYLQLITTGKSDNRVQEVSAISRALKQLARELQVPVIAPAQLNRAIEHRNPPVPHLADLRESGSIEQDADIVIFLHHPYLYSDNKPANVAQLIVAKHRNGPTGTIEVRWHAETADFQNLERLREAA